MNWQRPRAGAGVALRSAQPLPVASGTDALGEPVSVAFGRRRVEVVYSGAFLCALGYLLVEYGRPQNWLPVLGYIKPGMIAYLAGILALLSRGELPKDRHSKYLMAFVAVMAALVPFALNRNRAFFQTWSMFLTVFGGILPIAVFVDSFARLQRLLRFWLLVHISLALYALTHSGTGIGSFLSDENDLALAMNAALPYGVMLLVLERTAAMRILALVATCLIVLASVWSMSRGGFIGLTCVGVIIWLQSRRKVISLLAISVLCAAVVLVAPKKYWADMSTITSANKQGDTGYQRLYSWDIGWLMFLDHPIIGVGPNNYSHRAAEYEDERSNQIGYHLWGREAHSLYFTLLPEFGLIGTVVFVAMVLHGVVRRHRLKRLCRSIMERPAVSDGDREQARWLSQAAVGMDASLVGFLVSAIFLSVLYYPHIWVLVAFTAALDQVGAQLEARVPPAPSRSRQAPLRGSRVLRPSVADSPLTPLAHNP